MDDRRSRIPWVFVAGVVDELNRMRQLGKSGRDYGPERGMEWIPATDILVRGDDLLVLIDLAGVEADEVHIELDGAALTVSGDRRTPVAGAEAFLLRERPHGAFRRTIHLSGPVHASAVTADLAGGMLEITVRGGALDWGGPGRGVQVRARPTDPVRRPIR